MRHRILDTAILLATLALAVATVTWADGQFMSFSPPSDPLPPNVSERPAWVWTIYHPYRRFQHDLAWFNVVATLGAGALLARDGLNRRTFTRPGSSVVFVSILVGTSTVAHQYLAGRPRSSPAFGIAYDLRDILESSLPGVIIGVWVVSWLGSRRSRPAWRERLARLVAWLWIASVAMLLGFAILFG